MSSPIFGHWTFLSGQAEICKQWENYFWMSKVHFWTLDVQRNVRCSRHCFFRKSIRLENNFEFSVFPIDNILDNEHSNKCSVLYLDYGHSCRDRQKFVSSGKIIFECPKSFFFGRLTFKAKFNVPVIVPFWTFDIVS